MPNQIALLALAIYPLVAMALYGRIRADRALIWTLMVGYLFLPERPAAFDLPLFPPFTKHNIPALAAFVLALWHHGARGSILPASNLGKLLLAAFVLSPVATVLTNAEPIFFGQVGVPGLTLKDAAALLIEQFLLVLPFLMARQHLASGGALQEVLKALVWGGLAYSLLMLIEIRLSPQLNAWVYGFYQHQFGQSIRFGGFRPVVFLYHGIWVAFFAMTSAVAAWALWRFNSDGGFKMLLVALYMTAIVILSKSLGAALFLVFLVPMVVLTGVRTQIRVAILIGVLAIGYPILKGADLVPQDWLLAKANAIDPDRAGSLEFRFTNENTLLERAYRKPVFGWGSWGRNHILDPVDGHILTVTDGRWIIVIGIYGWVGFLAEFGLLILPLFLIGREVMARSQADISPMVGPLSLMLAINVSDMIPNATLTPMTWIVVGALMGYAEKLRAERLQITRDSAALRWQSVMQ